MMLLCMSAGASWVQRYAQSHRPEALTLANVDLHHGNRNGTLDRSQCVTYGLVKSVASQCGALRVIHPLPTARTYDKEQGPSLLYSSDWAVSYTVINTDISIVNGVALPTSVRTTLHLLHNGTSETQVDQRTDPGTSWSSGPQRVGLRLPTSVSAIYRFRVRVEFLVNGVWTSAAQAKDGELIAVRGSIARGWRLSGVETLVDGESGIGWVGGDGSTRVYRPTGRTTSNGTLVYAVRLDERVVRPESLFVNSLTGVVVRPTHGGGRVEFEGSRHVRTIGKLGDTTSIAYSYTGGVDSIYVAPRSTGIVWAFNWYRGRVVSVSSPGASARLNTSLVFEGDEDRRVTSITDPDSSVVIFSSDTSGLFTSRIDRRSTVSLFAFESLAPTLASIRTVLGIGDTVSHVFSNMQGRAALTTATVPFTLASRSTYDGPLASGDTLISWVERHGAMDSTMDAIGRVLRIARDTLYFGRIGQVITPGGYAQRATYDSRGNIASTTEVDPLGTGANATTTYFWDQTWDVLTKVKRPLGDSSAFGVDISTGAVTWAQQGGDLNRVIFDYWTSTAAPACAGRYRASSIPVHLERDSVEYNSLCNAVKVISRLGGMSVRAQNSVGRDTSTSMGPISANPRSVVRSSYDQWGRVTQTTSLGTGGEYSLPWNYSQPAFPADTTVVSQRFDAEGNLVALVRNGGKSTLTNQGNVSAVYTFDPLNRTLTDSTPGSGTVRFRYDKAGRLRFRISPVGDSVSMEYDLLGRLIRRVDPGRSYGALACSTVDTTSGLACDYTLPKSGTSLVVAADTTVMSYTLDGHLFRIDNRYARIRRTFNPNGSIAVDSSLVRTVDTSSSGSTETIGGLPSPGVSSDFAAHRYVLKSAYDINGRRRTIRYPDFVTSCGNHCQRDSLSFDGDGRLARIVDGRGGVYQFFSNAAGDVDSVSYPDGTKVRQRFNPDGQLLAHRVSGNTIGDSAWYDWAGRVAGSRELTDPFGTASYTYSGLGALVAMVYASPSSGEKRSEEFRADGIGQRFWARSYDEATGDAARTQTTVMDALGRARRTISDVERNYLYFADGATRVINIPASASLRSEQQALFYGADGRLRFVQRRQATAYSELFEGNRIVIDSGPARWVEEEHRYDGTGRRVLTRSQITGTCISIGCESSIQRFVWDGQQLVAETRGRGAPGTNAAQLESDTTSGNGDNGTPATYGQVWYSQAGGIDSPLGVIRLGGGTGKDSVAIPKVITIYPHANIRGIYAGATYSTTGGVPALLLPGAKALAFHAAWDPDDPPPPKIIGGWAGSLINDQATATGLNFRRNRFVDPMTGRFTSIDPIGLRGGLGVYIFAGGDPINFADPFGLKIADRGPCTINASKSGSDDQHYWGETENGGVGGFWTSDRLSALAAICGSFVICEKVLVLWSPFPRSFTWGDLVLIGRPDRARCQLQSFLHELFHVFQYHELGSEEYLRRGINDRVLERTHGVPFTYDPDRYSSDSLEPDAVRFARGARGTLPGGCR
jgi:RHS repeat-associated protein